MILTEVAPVWIRICLILVLVSGGFLLSSRSMSNLVRTYQFQSFLLVLIALGLCILEGHITLLLVAVLTLVSKVWGIPACIRLIQERIHIQQDLKFSYLRPPGALMLSILIILLVYVCFAQILESLYAASSLFFLGSVIGVSLVLMGLCGVYSEDGYPRSSAICRWRMGFFFGLFVTELPFFIEFVIIIDLIILVLLTSIMTVGIDSSIEEYKTRLQEFHLLSEEGGIS